MTTKEYLGQIENSSRMIQNKLSEIYQLKAMACSVGVSSDKERVQTSGSKDMLGNTVSKIVDLEKETDKMVDGYIEKRKHIISQIDSLTNKDYYSVLTLRYVLNNTFDEISEKMNYSIRNVFKLHGRALQEFEKLYGSEYLESA